MKGKEKEDEELRHFLIMECDSVFSNTILTNMEVVTVDKRV